MHRLFCIRIKLWENKHKGYRIACTGTIADRPSRRLPVSASSGRKNMPVSPGFVSRGGLQTPPWQVSPSSIVHPEERAWFASNTAQPQILPKGGAEPVSHIHTRAHTRPFGSTTPRKGAMPVNCSSISNSSWCARYRMVLRRPCRLVDWTLCCTRFPIPSAYEAA